ncbi:MAG: gliding motility-associated C-terminal domain-containing protein [Flavobacteriales bacterium]|nr:gliding motility-associated C-terminal domain-containing protein [Flavobacteriales bacterium]
MIKRITISVLFSLFYTISFGQAYNDGPIQLQVKVREVNTTFAATDEGALGVGFSPDELTYKLWVRDQPDVDGQSWIGGNCLESNFSPPGLSTDFNFSLYDFTYPGATAPQFFDLKLDAWEDDNNSDALLGFCSNGTRCDFNPPQCCGVPVFGVCVGLNEGDDLRCDADPFKLNMNYRLGPPCQWYNHGFVIGGGCNNNFYQPRIESYWRYTKGTSCNDPIVMGNVAPGFSTLSHFNSNECYSNTFPNSPGNDVFYEFTVIQGVGLKISLCAAANFNTTLYLLDANCNVIEFNDDFCAATSEINTSVCTPGTYKVVVDATSASEMGTFTLSISENPTVIVNAQAGSNQNTCLGIGTNIGGTPAATGGTPGYIYSWSPSQFLSDANVANPVANPPSTTWFYLTVTDDANCSRTDSVLVTVLPGPAVNLGNDTTLCVGSNLSINAGSGSFYFWSNGATSPSITVSQPGNYFVTVIDNFGCQGKDTVQVNQFPDLTPAIVPALSFCTGSQLILDAGTGYSSYLWNGQPGGSTFPVSSAGTVTLTVTDNNSCTYTISSQISENPLPTPDLGPDQTLCAGTAATLNPGAGYLSYLWNTGSADQLISVLQPGTYSVVVTDINGCQQTEEITINNYPSPALNLGPDIAICNTGNATLSAPAGFSSYFWSTGSTSSSIQVTASALYWVFATDNFGCTLSDTVSVNFSPQITVSQSAIGNVSCFGNSDGSASVNVSGGTPPLSYNWNNGTSTQNLLNVSGGVYELTVTDANSCTETLQIFIEEPPELAMLLDVTNNTCEQNNAGVVEAKIVGGVPPYLIQWSTGQSGVILSGLNSGDYFATVTDANGCVYSDTAIVYTLSISTGNDAIEVPNIFSPNNDNTNDILTLDFSITAYESFEFIIMNRWGNRVFYTQNPSDFWDGGKHPEGVYFYTLKTELKCGGNNDIIEKSGSITLVR